MAGAGIQDIAERLQGTAAEEWARKAAAGDAEAQWQLHQSLAYSDSGYFLNRFCWIRDFQEGWEKPFEEREIQAVLRKACLTENYVVGLKAREIGWTWVLALLCLWESWRFAPYQCIYLAQRKDNARQFISRIRFAAEKLPPELGFPTETKPKTQLRFAFTNSLGQESEILAFPSVPSSLQSWHPRRVIADEWGLINEPVLPAALGAVGLRGYFVGLGTAEGLDNEHAQVYISCRDGYGDLYAPKGKKFHHVFGSWMDNPDFHVRPSGGTERDTERMYPENDQQAFALTFGGQPVYPEFNMGLHVAKENIQAERGRPLIRGWDFGNCYSDDTEVLTRSGWVPFKRLRKDAVVATLNPRTFELEYTKIRFKVAFDYEGEMVHWKNKRLDCLISPEHMVPHTRRDTPEQIRFAPAEQLEKELSAHRYLQLQALWYGRDQKGKQYGPCKWDSMVFADFMGMYLSEGSAGDRKVTIYQKERREDWEVALARTGLAWRWNEKNEKTRGWTCYSAKLARWLREMGHTARTKRIPEAIRFMPTTALWLFLVRYTQGDGHIRNRSSFGREKEEHTVYTASKRMADDLQEVAMKLGWSATITERKPAGSVLGGRVIKSGHGFDLRFIHETARVEIQPHHSSRVPYKGKIYCCSVPYHTLYVRRNGKAHWNGNTPACVVFQLQTSGKICILREFQSLNPGITEFGTLVRDECNMEWPDSIWQDWGDPSGDIPRETDGKTCFEHLLKLGIRCKGGRANFAERRESVANRLTRLVDGEPSLLVSPRCQIMIQGFAGGYRFPPHTDEEAYDAFRRQRESGRARLRGRVGDA